MAIATLHQSHVRLLDAAQKVIRAQGYAATTVDDICAAAGLSKGSFFHHFKAKEDLVLAAVAHWNAWTENVFAAADYHQAEDPRERVLGYVDLRLRLLDRPVPEYTCLLGTLVQETYLTHPAVRVACDEGMSRHIDHLVEDLEAARRRHVPHADWTAESVGYFMQAVLQGSFIFSKAKLDAQVVRANLQHLRRYLESLLSSAH